MTAKETSPPTTVIALGMAMIVIGIASALLLSSGFDGFVKGMFQGAGIALILLGVAYMSMAARKGSWLPSRDHGDE